MVESRKIFVSSSTFHKPCANESGLLQRPQQYKTYNKEKITKAQEAVQKGISVRRAAEEYGIPKSTLHDRIVGKVGSKSGPRRYLDSCEEIELLNFLSHCSSLGYSRTRQQVIDLVQETVNMKGIQTKVSAGWWKSFQSRHQDLILRQPEPISQSRLAATSDVVLTNYFDLLESTLRDCDLTERPSQIFNLDESGFPLSPKPLKVIAKKGSRHPMCITGQDKSQITVLACVSASGYAIPPLVIFDRQTLREELVNGEVPGTMYALSSSGWMNSEIFEAWFSNHFLSHVPPSRPLLLMIDGHSSHFSPSFVNRAAEEEVVVLCLPPNTTHKTQPLDKGVFSPLKRAWREECHLYMQNNPGKVVTRYQFSSLFCRAWLKAVTPTNIISGFRVSGIFPVDRYKLLPSSADECSSSKFCYRPMLTPVGPYHSPHLNVSNSVQINRSDSLLDANTTIFSVNDSSDSSAFFHDLSATTLCLPDTPTPYEVNPSPCLQQPNVQKPFTQEEIIKYAKRLEEGYDIKTDKRYNYWLSLMGTNHVEKQNVCPRKNTLLSKVITAHEPQIKYPVPQPKQSARVITSEENRKLINEKNEKKLEAERQKEERKLQRERKKIKMQMMKDEKQKLKLQKVTANNFTKSAIGIAGSERVSFCTCQHE
jgi:hypothetical protein